MTSVEAATNRVTYSIANYGRMIAPGPRLDAYEAAMREAIGPGSTVVDIGTGTGYFALLAARLGAERVYAIEPDEAIQVGRELARVNGLDDRITFIQDRSTEVTFKERCDVIVSDLRGVLPLYGAHVPSLVDARTRLLKAGGALIPQADSIRVAVGHDPEFYAKQVEPWASVTNGLSMEPQRRRTVNTRFSHRVNFDDLLTEPQTWATLQYASIESPDVDGEVAWDMDRDGIAHGLSMWFDAEIGSGAGFTTGPEGPELVYGTAFFPFEQPLDLEAGDQLHVDLRAKLVADDYTWIWNTRVVGPDGTVRTTFMQSTLHGSPVTTERLRQRATDFSPRLDDRGRADAFILGRMNGDHSLSAIAEEVVDKFPAAFAGTREALSHVGDLSVRYATRSR